MACHRSLDNIERPTPSKRREPPKNSVSRQPSFLTSTEAMGPVYIDIV